MKFFQVVLIFTIIHLYQRSLAQTTDETCTQLLTRMEELVGKGGIAEVASIVMTAEALCKEEFSEESKQYGEVISFIGLIHQVTGNFDEAAKYYLRQRDLWNNLSLSIYEEEYGVIQSNLSGIYFSLGDMKKAMLHNDTALIVAYKAHGESNASYANRLTTKGLIFYRDINPNLDSSVFYLLRGIQILRNNPNDAFLIKGLNGLGIVYLQKGDPSTALIYLQEAYQLARATYGEGHPSTAMIMGSIGASLFQLGEFYASEKLLDQTVLFFEKANYTSHPTYGMMLMNQSTVKGSLGKYDEAIETRDKVWKYATMTGPLDSAEYLAANGIISMVTGNEFEAIQLLSNALQLFEKAGHTNSQNYIAALQNLGNVYMVLGNYQKAIIYFHKALAILERKSEEPNSMYPVLATSTANIYTLLGNISAAQVLQEKALQLALKSKVKTPILAHTYYSIGFMYSETGNNKFARKYINKSRRILEKTISLENTEYCKNLHSLSRLESLRGHYNEAARLSSKAISLLENGGNERTELYLSCLIEYADIQSKRGKITEAFRLFGEVQNHFFDRIDDNFTFLSESGKERFLLTNGDYSRTLLVYVNRNYETIPQSIGLAFNSELGIKGMLLNSVQSVTSAIRFSGDSVLLNQLHQWKTTKQLLARQFSLPADERLVQRKVLDSLALVSEDQESQLIISSADFREARSRVQWNQIRDFLKPGEAAIEFTQVRYFKGENPLDSVYYAAMVLRPGNDYPAYIPLFGESQLIEHLLHSTGLEDIKEKIAITYSGKSQTQLYNIIWKPLELILDGIHTVYYAPTGLLHRISFPAISGVDENPLLLKFDLRMVGSTRELVFSKGNFPGNAVQTALMIGGIEYAADSTCLAKASMQDSLEQKSPDNFAFTDILRDGCENGMVLFLPGTKIETDKLSYLFRNRTSIRQLQGCFASEEAIKVLGREKSSDDVLHIATHGFYCDNVNKFSAEIPALFRSGLLLAGSQHVWMGGEPYRNMDDGILYAYEVNGINLTGTKLVVLSACETALGDIKGNEGVYGLARSFLIAGVDHVMMSLWQISDDKTVRFMELFYNHWLDGKDIRDAFHTTQLELHKAGVGEEVWGAFVLI